MRAFVTGASGFIGGHLAAELVRRGWTVKALIHKTSIPTSPGVEIVSGDVGDTVLLKKSLRGSDVLFHLAAALGASRIGGEEFLRINAGGTESVLSSAREAGVRKSVHFSSAGVIGKVSRGDLADEGYPLDPRNVYDRTKLEGEKIALRHASEGMDVVIVRPGWAYGPGDRRTLKLIKSIDRGRFFMVARGVGRQTPVFVNDLVEGTIVASTRGKRGEIYHLAGREVLGVERMAELIAAACGKKIPRFSLPFIPAKFAAFVLEKLFGMAGREAPLSRSKLSFFVDPKAMSIHKAERELGYSPRTDFAEGIGLTVAWYRENGWL